jgi:hypothetical protein
MEVIAVIGTLAGTITGAAIVSFGNIYLAKRRERLEFRTACRLVATEFHVAQLTVKQALEAKHWWRPDEELTTEAWKQYKHVLAPYVPYEAWDDLWLAAKEINHANLLAAAPRQTGKEQEIYLPETARALTVLLQGIERGRMALMPYLVGRFTRWLWLLSNRLSQLTKRS